VLTSLIRRTVQPGRAYAAIDLDNPGAETLAVAWKAEDGWRVAVGAGRVVATGLPTQARALNAMDRAANDQLNRGAVRAALTEPSLEEAVR